MITVGNWAAYCLAALWAAYCVTGAAWWAHVTWRSRAACRDCR